MAQRPSIIELREFYTSPLGRKVKQRLQQLLLRDWPSSEQQHVVGIGYAAPVMRALERSASATMVALMPADQGAIYWPVHQDNRSVLADEMLPPFAVNSLHAVLMLHVFEYAASPQDLLKIYWELLAPGGRLVLVVPNRRGYWASIGNTPFTQGTPYSITQLKELLSEAKFTLRHTQTALFTPPLLHPLLQRLWPMWEWVGRVLYPSFGGVIMLEAEKQIYAGIAQPLNMPVRRKSWRQQPVVAVSGKDALSNGA